MEEKNLQEVAESKLVAIVSSTNEPIMVADRENPILEDLKKQDGVVVHTMAEYLDNIEGSEISEEDKKLLLEKINTLVLLDEVDQTMIGMVTDKLKKREEAIKAAEANATLLEKEANDKGYTIANRNGTLRRLEEKVERNDYCPCGSGKKYKKCHLNA